uniref:Uncharacterized protein n=1 Tax=Vespula pensylvanica TaxID=30213 RepID=A0A834K6V2_VESPE|nr:hypothetical protein H0235_015978 [Vespula pensylvanica]
MLALLKERYWPIDSGRKSLRSLIYGFMTCQRANPTIPDHIMDNLPLHRITCNRPFFILGSDYCEPMYIKERVHRNRGNLKVYSVCLEHTSSSFGDNKRFDDLQDFIATNHELKELWESVKVSEKENSFLKRKAYNGASFCCDFHTLADLGRLPLRRSSGVSYMWTITHYRSNGRIIDTYPGIVRVASVRTAMGIYKSNIKDFYPLPIDDS